MGDLLMEKIALDIHTHLIPNDAAALASFAGVSWDAGAEQLTIDGHKLWPRELFHPEALIGWLDRNNIQQAWISIPPPLYRPQLTEEEAARWCDYLNRGLQEIAQRHADRLTALPYLPVEHPGLALRMARAAIAQGQRRFAMASGAGPEMRLSDPAYNELWRALDEASGFLFIHPGETFDPRMQPFYLANLLGNPTETAVAAAHLVLSGILERHPRMLVCLAHGGGTALALAGRWRRGHATERPGLDRTLEAPPETLRRLTVDCILHDAATLSFAAEVYGAGKILFGSDWPFPMGLPQPHQQMADADPALRRRVFQDNPEQLLRR
jgi:aminocarboxymuconate-semialdehyde decarboxylase